LWHSHILLTYVITFLFIAVAKNILLRNAWSAVAEVCGAETRELLDQALMLLDWAVEDRVKEMGRGGLLVGIGGKNKEKACRAS
jgi:hypothetical protein